MNRELSIETKYQQRVPIVSVFQRKNAPPRFLRLYWAGRGAFISTSSESASAKGMGGSFFFIVFYVLQYYLYGYVLVTSQCLLK